MVVGASVVGASVTGTAVVGASVTGAAVVGACVTGAAVVGASVAGAAVVRASVAGAFVVGAAGKREHPHRSDRERINVSILLYCFFMKNLHVKTGIIIEQMAIKLNGSYLFCLYSLCPRCSCIREER